MTDSREYRRARYARTLQRSRAMLAACHRLSRRLIDRLYASRHRAAAAAAREARLRLTLESMGEAFYFLDSSLRVIDVSRRELAFLGREEGQVIGHPFLDVFPAARGSALYALAEEALRTRAPCRTEGASPITGRWIEFEAVPSPDGGLAIIFRDLHARHEAEEALRRSEGRFRAITDAIPGFVWVTDAAGANIYVNQRYADFTGLPVEALLGDGWTQIMHPDDLAPTADSWQRTIAAGTTYETEHRFRAADGTFRWMMTRGIAMDVDGERRWYGSSTDIEDQVRAREIVRRDTAQMAQIVEDRTAELSDANARLRAQMQERERLEEQLRQVQKMEAVGQLTGGIAHDFNNMLAVVMGNIELLARASDDAARVERFAGRAMQGASRAAALTQRLLAFARQTPLSPELVEPNRLVSGMSELLRGSIGAEIKIETVLAAGLWRVNTDRNQLENTLLNLAVNGRDAMEDHPSGGGRLTIETANAYLDDAYAAAHVGVSPGQYVMLAVTDTGHGMPPEVQARAFEPFFTTKTVGQGTGLGLSQVYGFLRQSGGHVKIYSEMGQGTTVRLYLPRAQGAAVPEDVGGAVVIPLAPADCGTLLVVDDEELVREFSADALRSLGYTVRVADGAARALEALAEDATISLLFTDIVMPEVNGRKLADEARARRPDLRVLYTTGYTRNAIVHNGVLEPGVHLITKPFTLYELASRVRALFTPLP